MAKKVIPPRPEESLTFEELSKWQAGRVRAGHTEQADEIVKRAVALAAHEHPGKKVERDPKTHELVLVEDAPPKPPTIAELQAAYEDAWLECEEAKNLFLAAGGKLDEKGNVAKTTGEAK